MAEDGNWWDTDDAEESPSQNQKEEDEPSPTGLETEQPYSGNDTNELLVDFPQPEPLLDFGEQEQKEEYDDTPKTRKPLSTADVTVNGTTEAKSEALLIIEAKQRKREEDDIEELRALEEQRRLQREKEEEELRRLKEKQVAEEALAQRKKEREEEEVRLAQQKQAAEEQRRKEEEARRLKSEEEKKQKMEEAERKKAAAQAAMAGGRNFTIERRKSGENTIDKFMNISKAKTEMSLNAGELEALKRRTLADRMKPFSVSDLDHGELKNKAEELWNTIVQLETTNYDLGERFKRQEYDLKEINERQRQINHKKHVAQGLDPESASSRYPPKVQLISKYERRTDRRTFEERRSLFEQDKKSLEPRETFKPAAKRREVWIRSKDSDERKTRSYDDELEYQRSETETEEGVGSLSRSQSVPVEAEHDEPEEEYGRTEEPVEEENAGLDDIAEENSEQLNTEA